MIRKAHAEWKGNLTEGKGTVGVESGLFDGAGYSFTSRFENGTGTNPEELIGAAHAGCFSMAFSLMLDEAGFTPDSVKTEADVSIEKQDGGFAITGILLKTEGKVPKIDEGKFKEIAEQAKTGCPVSQALKAVPISLEAKLV